MSGHISRLEGRKARGWQVRIPPGQPRKYTSKMFSDKVFGGKQKAKAAAKEYLADHAVEGASPHYNYLSGRGVLKLVNRKINKHLQLLVFYSTFVLQN